MLVSRSMRSITEANLGTDNYCKKAIVKKDKCRQNAQTHRHRTSLSKVLIMKH